MKSGISKSHGEKKSVAKIAEGLGRSIHSVRSKVSDLGLGIFVDCSNYFTLTQIGRLLGVSSMTIKYWVDKKGLKARKLKIGDKNALYLCVHATALRKWLEDNQNKWDSQYLGSHVLGPEPEWLKQKRIADASKAKVIRGHWSAEEDDILSRMYRAGHKHRDIASKLNRSLYSVQHRVHCLDIWGTGKCIAKEAG